MQGVLRFLLKALVAFGLAELLPGVTVAGYGWTILLLLVLSALDLFIRPLVSLLSLPITILTLGLFSLVLDALFILLADWLTPGFEVSGFWSALLYAVLLMVSFRVLDNAVATQPAA